jgi:hypothetical protein
MVVVIALGIVVFVVVVGIPIVVAGPETVFEVGFAIVLEIVVVVGH